MSELQQQMTIAILGVGALVLVLIGYYKKEDKK